MIMFVEIIECTCETLSPLTRVVMHPLFNDNSDALSYAGARTFVKVIEIPWVFMTSGGATFEPLFDSLLTEDTGLLPAGAAVLNEHLHAVIDFMQEDLPFHFHAPPFFSIQHRMLACYTLEPLRMAIKVAAVIPQLMLGHSINYADLVRDKASMHGTRLQCEKFWHVLAVDCFATLNGFFRPFGEWYAATKNVGLHSMELGWNSSLTGAFGIGVLDHVQGETVPCTIKLTYSDNWFTRLKYSAMLFVQRYCDENIPLQEIVA